MKNRKIKVDGRARPLRAPEEPASEDPPSKPTCTIAPGELKQPRRESPQETVNKFWRQMSSKHPGKLFTILPGNQHARSGAAKTLPNTDSCHWVARSYEVARAECEKKVTRIIKECRRVYQKYRDWEFDVEDDLKNHTRDCLDGLEGPAIDLQPMGIRRVADIFENPQFFIKEPRADGIRQGDIGNCYLMAALCSMGNVEGLIDKICVMHDEACQAVGVYGFVFFRDGEWEHTIIDDRLYTSTPDYYEATEQQLRTWNEVKRVDSAREYRKAHLTGSKALYFAQCNDQNETWLPLLEKAYAKAHGDYASIDGGFAGEALVDLTGGVASEVWCTAILDRDVFWREELLKIGTDFLFVCGSGVDSKWIRRIESKVKSDHEHRSDEQPGPREGIFENHAYSIMAAREINGQRLLKLRNPFCSGEWTGMMVFSGYPTRIYSKCGDRLNEQEDLDPSGSIRSAGRAWMCLGVNNGKGTKFALTLKESTRVVIVLSQLDIEYFRGLEGAFQFDFEFCLKSDQSEDDDNYIVLSNEAYTLNRSQSTEVDLGAGTYFVLVRVLASKDGEPVEDLLPNYVAKNRGKLVNVGASYDLAHAKGVHVATDAEKKERKARAKRWREKEREKMKAKAKAQARKDWEKQKKNHELDARRVARTTRLMQLKSRAQRPEKDALDNNHAVVSSATVGEPVEPMEGAKLQRKPAPKPTEEASAAEKTVQPLSPETPSTEVTNLLSKLRLDPSHHKGRAAQKFAQRGNTPKGDEASTSRTSDGCDSSEGFDEADSHSTPYPPFEWDSELDFSDHLSSDSDSDSDKFFNNGQRKDRYFAKSAKGEILDEQEDENDEDQFVEPWNAVCILGLRVYSTLSAEKVKLKVFRPSEYSDNEEVA